VGADDVVGPHETYSPTELVVRAGRIRLWRVLEAVGSSLDDSDRRRFYSWRPRSERRTRASSRRPRHYSPRLRSSSYGGTGGSPNASFRHRSHSVAGDEQTPRQERLVLVLRRIARRATGRSSPCRSSW